MPNQCRLIATFRCLITTSVFLGLSVSHLNAAETPNGLCYISANETVIGSGFCRSSTLYNGCECVTKYSSIRFFCSQQGKIVEVTLKKEQRFTLDFANPLYDP